MAYSMWLEFVHLLLPKNPHFWNVLSSRGLRGHSSCNFLEFNKRLTVHVYLPKWFYESTVWTKPEGLITPFSLQYFEANFLLCRIRHIQTGGHSSCKRSWEKAGKLIRNLYLFSSEFSLRKHPFLLALRRRGNALIVAKRPYRRRAGRNGCFRRLLWIHSWQ